MHFPVTPTVLEGCGGFIPCFFLQRPPSGFSDGGLFLRPLFFRAPAAPPHTGRNPPRSLVPCSSRWPPPPLARGWRRAPWAAGRGAPPPGGGPPGDLGGHRLGIAAALGHGAADEHLVVAGLGRPPCPACRSCRIAWPPSSGRSGGPLDVVAGAGGDIVQTQLLRHPAAQQAHDLILHVLLGVVRPVLLRQEMVMPPPGPWGRW